MKTAILIILILIVLELIRIIKTAPTMPEDFIDSRDEYIIKESLKKA